jgi:hypothetical protein
MSKTTYAGDLHPSATGAPPIGVGVRGRSDVPEAVLHSNVELLLRRLRFFLDLLSTGYRQALAPDPLAGSLRGERIALGIDLPELDAVPLWSARGRGGTICVPFVEFILGQIVEIIEALASEIAPFDAATSRDMETVRQAVVRTLDEACAGGEPAPSLPRLRDVYLPAPVLETLCGSGGSLAPIVRRCEALLRGNTRVSEH